MTKKSHFTLHFRHKLGRRKFLVMLGGSLVSAIAACKSSGSRNDDSSLSPPSRDKEPLPEASPSPKPSAGPSPTPKSNQGADCTLGPASFDLSKIVEGDDTFNATYTLYGSPNSALAAFNITFFNDKISAFYLTDESGRPFVHRFISLDIDQNLDQTYKTFVFDNLALEDCQKITAVFHTNDNTYVKKTPNDTHSFAATFRGRPVRIKHTNLVFKTLCYSLINRLCQTAVSEEVCPFPELVDCTITALNGEVLSEHGYDFTNIIDNDYVVVYKLSDSADYYDRTLVCFA